LKIEDSTRNPVDCTTVAPDNDDINLFSALNNSDQPVHGGTGYTFNNLDTNVGDRLAFRNRYGECVKYFVENGRIKISRDNGVTAPIPSYYITPANIEITHLKFRVFDHDPANLHPTVTMSIGVKTKGKRLQVQAFDIQTTVGSRAY